MRKETLGRVGFAVRGLLLFVIGIAISISLGKEHGSPIGWAVFFFYGVLSDIYMRLCRISNKLGDDL
jgi:hypothetical protein